MNKWFGKIGFVDTVETSSGIWEEQVTVREYRGDVIRNSRRLQSTDQVNDNVNISNQISILSDPYANDHIYSIRYAEFQGTKWKVSDVEVQYPRLILTLGGVYNGK